MATSNNFIEHYKTINDTELLSILDNLKDYQPLAVEAAKEEFSNRKLSEIQIQKARQQLISIQQQKDKDKEKLKAVETKIKTAGHTFIDTINPIQSGLPTTEKTIRLTVIIFGGIFLYKLINNFQTHLGFFKDIAKFPFYSVLYLLPEILLPVAVFLFWKKKSIGWILLTVFLTFSAVNLTWAIIRSYISRPTSFGMLSNLISNVSPTVFIIPLLFFIANIYVLCKNNIREVFKIDKDKMAITIVISGLLTFLLFFVISY